MRVSHPPVSPSTRLEVSAAPSAEAVADLVSRQAFDTSCPSAARDVRAILWLTRRHFAACHPMATFWTGLIVGGRPLAACWPSDPEPDLGDAASDYGAGALRCLGLNPR